MLYTDEFLSYLKLERNYSDATIGNYGEDLSLFDRYMQQIRADNHPTETDPTLIDSEDVRSWMAQMMEEGKKTTSVNRRLSTLHSFFKYLQTTRRIQRDPTHKLQGPKNPRPLPYFLKESEVDELLDAPIDPTSFEAVRNRLIIEIFYAAGLRVSEMAQLNVSDIDLPAAQLKVTGKGNKQRIIPFGSELKHDIEAYLPLRAQLGSNDRALMLTGKGRRMSAELIRRQVKKLIATVSTIKKNSPHVLRHTFATTMLNHQADLEVVKQLLGHESLAATEIYTHTTFEELKKVYNKAHPRS